MTKILIVEDDRITALDLKTLLTLRNYEVVEMTSSRESALRAAEKLRPDIVLMDIYLDGSTDGIAIARELRESMDIPVIFLTASSDHKTLELAKTANAYGYIIKPFDETNIYATIEIAVYKHGIEKKLQAEIAERAKAEESLKYRIGLERLISGISSRFINLPVSGIEGEIASSLEKIGTFTRSDRSFVFLLSSDGAAMGIALDWCADGFRSLKDSLQGLKVRDYPWWMRNLEESEIVYIPDLAALPKEARPERKILQESGVRSLLAVPMRYGGALIGFLGFETGAGERKWTDEDITLLRPVADIFSSALEHRESTRQLRESELRLRSLFDGNIDGIILIDENGRFIECNKSFLEMLGYSLEEMKKLSFFDITPAQWHTWHRNKFIDRRPSLNGSSAVHQVEYVKKDGTVFPAEIITYRIDLGGGKPFLWALVRDITAGKAAERSMNHQVLFLQTLLDTVPIPVFYKDRGGLYLGCNKAYEDFIGKEKREIIGKTVYDMGPKEIADTYFEKDRELFESPGQPQVYEWKVRTGSGEVRDVIFHKAAFFDPAGGVAGIIGAVQDVTGKKNG